MIKKNKFIKVSFVLIACLTLVFTGVLSIVNNNTNNVVNADVIDYSYSYNGSNVFLPIRTQRTYPSIYFDNLYYAKIDFNRDVDYLYFNIILKHFNNSPTGNFYSISNTDSVLGFSTLTYNKSISFQIDTYNYNFSYRLNVNSVDFNCNIVKIVFNNDIDNNAYFNHILFYDNNDNYLDFSFEVQSVESRFDYRIYFLNNNFTDNDFYNNGYGVGYNAGLNTGYDNGFDSGIDSGYDNGYAVGYHDGVLEANDYSFFSLIGAVIDAPLIAITSLFNFDLLGVNLLGFITALLTLAVVLFIIRLIWLK